MIPITVVTGFLGAGKTSLVAHLLDSVTDRTLAVVVNDMAPRSMDGAYLRGGEFLQAADSNGSIRTIAGGRIGAGKHDLLRTEILDLLAGPDKPDAIVVETSGGSPAVALGEALEQDPELNEQVRLDSIITVIDTSTIALWWRDHLLRPVLTDQLNAADLIVLNKYDRAGFFARMRARMIVRSVTGSVPVCAAKYGRLDPTDILDTGRRETAATSASPTPATVRRGDPNHYPLVARQLEEQRPFHPERLDAWLNREWHGIVRIKGFLWLATDMDHVYVVDTAGGQRELGLEGTWYGALPPDDLPDDPRIHTAVQNHPYQDRRQSITVIGLPEAVEREMRNLRAALLSVPEMDRGAPAWATLPDPVRPQFIERETRESSPENQSR